MSILAVTAPAARRGLTAIATVKREFGITGSADHEFLEDLIRQASAAGLPHSPPAAPLSARPGLPSTARSAFRDSSDS